MDAREARRGVARIHRAIAIGQLRPLTGRATFGVTLANDNRRVFQLRIRCDDPEAVINGAELIGNPHAHMSVGGCGSAFGMKGDEVERRADLAGRVVGAAQTMFDEIPREPATAAGGVRTADLRRGQPAPYGVDRVIV